MADLSYKLSDAPPAVQPPLEKWSHEAVMKWFNLLPENDKKKFGAFFNDPKRFPLEAEGKDLARMKEERFVALLGDVLGASLYEELQPLKAKAASGPPPAQLSEAFAPRSAAEAAEVTDLCKKHTSLDAVFQAVQWLSVSAHEALGDAIDSSHDQVLTRLESAADREFFGALVLWIHRKKSLRAKFYDTSQPISLSQSPWLLQTLQSLHLLEYEVLLLLVPHQVFQTRLRLFAAPGAPAARAFGPLVAEARKVYLAWERGPWKARVANALGDEVVTQFDIRIKRSDSLDDVNLLEKQCEAALWPYLFIYRDVSMNERDVFASRQAARVEEEMKNAWTKTCKPYLDRVDIIKRAVEINGPKAGLLQRIKNKYLEPCNVCPADETLRNGSSYTYDVVRRWATLMAARASTPDQALEVKWDNHLWVYLFDACFDQVVDSLTLHRREKKSISASTVRAKIKKVDAIVTPKSEEQPEILYLESQLPGDEKHFVEDRDKLFKLMKAELIWRISRKISTLVLGMMTQGPAVQLYLMDLCTYDSLMIVKVADLSLYHNKQADLASFLDVAVQMLAAREL